MKEIADKLNSMEGIRVLKDRPRKLLFDKFHWLQFLCSNKESLDIILHACTGANAMMNIEEGWGTEEIPESIYVYTLLMEESRIEPFKCFMGMPYRVVGGIKPILAKDVSWIKDLMPQEEESIVAPKNSLTFVYLGIIAILTILLVGVLFS